MSNDVTGIERVDPTPTSDIFVATLKGLFGLLFPPIGQGIEAFANWRSRVKQERINSFFSEAIKQIEKNTVDYEFLKTEEFSDLLEEILVEVSVNRSEVKREHYKNLLLAAVRGHRPPDLSKLFLKILDLMIDDEINIFAYLCNIHNGEEPFSINNDIRDARWFFPEERIRDLGLEPLQFKVLTLALASKGLISFNNQDEPFGQYAALNHSYSRITPLGLQFYNYLVAR